MKYLLIAILLSSMAIQAKAQTCSKSFLDEFKNRGLRSTVQEASAAVGDLAFLGEKSLVQNAAYQPDQQLVPLAVFRSANEDVQKVLDESISNKQVPFQLQFGSIKHKVEERPIPKISEVKSCLMAAKLSLLSDTCSYTLRKAAEFSSHLDNQEDNADLQQIIRDFSDYDYIPKEEEIGFYENLDYKQIDRIFNAEDAELKTTDGVEEIFQEKEDDDHFRKMKKMMEFCRAEDEVPFVAIEEVSESTGFANIDVYNNGVVTCTMVAPIRDLKVHFKVPDEFKDCVTKSDAIVVNVEQKLEDGSLVSKKIAGSVDELTSRFKGEKPKLIAKAEHVETIDSLLTNLEEGSIEEGFAAALVKVGRLSKIEKASNLDRKAIEIIALCSGQLQFGEDETSPSIDKLDEFVKRFKQIIDKSYGINEINSAISAPASISVKAISIDESASNKELVQVADRGNLFAHIYRKFLINLELQPEIKNLFEAYQNGKLSPIDVLNEEGNMMCSLVEDLRMKKRANIYDRFEQVERNYEIQPAPAAVAATVAEEKE